MKPIRNIPNIRMKATLEPFVKADKLFPNYFRLFKNPEEIVEENSFFSSSFSGGDIFSMNEHYGDRKNAMDYILRQLDGEECLSLYLSYDFSLAPVTEEYCTDGEFKYVKELIEKNLAETDLYLFFMVSHFNQLVGKPLREKTEHYHALICKARNFDDIEYDIAVNSFADKLKNMELISLLNFIVSN